MVHHSHSSRSDGYERIFCRKFRPELLAINGSYRRAADFAAELWDRTVQARLKGLRMSLTPLD